MKKTALNPQAMLSALSDIWNKCCISPAKISAKEMAAKGDEALGKKAQWLPSALTSIGILKVTDDSTRPTTYKWATSVPSLQMATDACRELDRTVALYWNLQKKGLSDRPKGPTLAGALEAVRKLRKVSDDAEYQRALDDCCKAISKYYLPFDGYKCSK